MRIFVPRQARVMYDQWLLDNAARQAAHQAQHDAERAAQAAAHTAALEAAHAAEAVVQVFLGITFPL